MQHQAELLIPIVGMVTGIIIPIAVFIWLYFDAKGKRETALEISKNLDDSSKVEELLRIFEERKKEPIDYRRNGVITLFSGIGLFLFGIFFQKIDKRLGRAAFYSYIYRLKVIIPEVLNTHTTPKTINPNLSLKLIP